jgi:hypothetical protein
MCEKTKLPNLASSLTEFLDEATGLIGEGSSNHYWGCVRPQDSSRRAQKDGRLLPARTASSGSEKLDSKER